MSTLEDVAALIPSSLPEPINVTVKEACRQGGFGVTTCYELLKQGKLKSVTIGQRRLINYASLKRLATTGG